ncbi:DUF2089 domain-containing protein [Actinobacteria bacterium YIM 96077]|uniref:DUF2089 domain-containing protein n=1 Tax=Phytoactinopolyspora halophila TaxID=1981511 RepID=A0A329QI85_9ACTN|nr:DUF2089 domain-containing protein [Phytoactinopolyspora halophila]AYY15646.1 DUF2089 domain-containing protein [Actinobacteria bacterium YIM 96077]RAW11946.1 DUF2089 domain-containing protein [Phytoactinopolyspora halophila]
MPPSPRAGREAEGYQPPRECPVCANVLHVTRLGCEACGTELSGRFTGCTYCSLSAQDRKILRVFLTSRGNMKELARELGVSYPTARVRYSELLGRLGIEEADVTVSDAEPVDREDVLRRLAAGELDLEEATELLS